MNCGNVVNAPELKLATMKSSKLIAKLSSAAATMPGTSSGKVTFQNVIGPDANRSDRKSTRLNSSHVAISYAVFCLKKKKRHTNLDKVLLTDAGVHLAAKEASREVEGQAGQNGSHQQHPEGACQARQDSDDAHTAAT